MRELYRVGSWHPPGTWNTSETLLWNTDKTAREGKLSSYGMCTQYILVVIYRRFRTANRSDIYCVTSQKCKAFNYTQTEGLDLEREGLQISSVCRLPTQYNSQERHRAEGHYKKTHDIS